MIPANKYCPSCKHRFLVDPSIRENNCPGCGVTYYVNPALSDTEMSRGGFTIRLLNKENERINNILAYVYEHPSACSFDIAYRLKIPISTVRGYIRKLKAENLLVVKRRSRVLYVICSELYIPHENELEAQEEETCVFCGKKTRILKKGKCESCIAQQKLIYERFRDLSREAEKNINLQQRNKNAVTA